MVVSSQLKPTIAILKMLEKANNQGKIATGSDICQYKLMNVKQAPLDNRQEHLDVFCFPTLFPTGQYGEHHPRQSYSAQTLSLILTNT